ncbi:STAS domain-containing protein [Sorangium cellulosum]|uniref:STAS domain-containing protein n=1 Tax=Sorangium cellulosum TaxID=56 RepID=UPI001F5CC410|nr:STAS domain-containing protein [Sorangium cellulosum]
MSRTGVGVDSVLADERSLVELLRVVTVDVHEAASVEEALHRTIVHICDRLGWPVGHVYVPAAEDPSLLLPTALWYLDDEVKFATFKAVTEATQFTRGVGLPGRVLASKQPAWVRNVREDANFPRARLAKNLGVKTGFAFPVVIGAAEVVAVLEFFSDAEYGDDGTFLATIGRIARQLGRLFERKHAQEMLSRERDFLAGVMDLVDGLIVVLDARGRIVRMNRAAERALGRALSLFGPRHLWDLTPDPAASARLRALFEELGAGGRRQQVEVPWTAGDGARRVTAWSGAVLRGKNGASRFVIMTGIDLTERKRAEEERARLQEEVIRAQDAALAKLSVPLIPLGDDVVVLPLIGPLEAQRARRMIEALSRGIAARRTRIAIVDLTGVDDLDAPAVQTLLDLVRVARLLGAQVVMTGIRPEVAQRLAAGGTDVSRLVVKGSLQSGIAFAMRGR